MQDQKMADREMQDQNFPKISQITNRMKNLHADAMMKMMMLLMVLCLLQVQRLQLCCVLLC